MAKLFNARATLHRYFAASVVCAVVAIMPAAALAGPCTQQIDAFELKIKRTAANPDAGPTAPETTGARLGHQPTIASMHRAEDGAAARFNTRLARARALDAAGDRAGCIRALADAERTYELPLANPEGGSP